jgi:hypothetical protein
MANAIYFNCDHTVTVTGLRVGSATYLNDATVTYALKTASGTSVSTGTLTYVAASNGNYSGSIESSVTGTLTVGAMYVLEVTAVESPYDDFRRLELWCSYRGSV